MTHPCGFPGRPRNGSSVTASPISRPGDTAQYSCRPGYTLFGDEERVCLESGIWAGRQPICGKYCSCIDKGGHESPAAMTGGHNFFFCYLFIKSSHLISFPELNLVLEKPALMSAQLWNYKPGLAVDGNTETCSFTPRTSEQRWWQVDLTVDQHIGSVALVISQGSKKKIFKIFSKNPLNKIVTPEFPREKRILNDKSVDLTLLHTNQEKKIP